MNAIIVGYVRAYNHKCQLVQDILSGWFVWLLAYASIIGLFIAQLNFYKIKLIDGHSSFVQSGLFWVLMAWNYRAMAAVGWVIRQWNPVRPQFALLSFSLTAVLYGLLQIARHWDQDFQNIFVHAYWPLALLRIIVELLLVPIAVFWGGGLLSSLAVHRKSE